MDAKCTAAEAVARGVMILNSKKGQYGLGTGNYHPVSQWTPGMFNIDVPWTGPNSESDCAGFAICFAWKLVRHRPGFNRGTWATVSDDINVNSAIEDGLNKGELFTTYLDRRHDSPQIGDLLCYPTFRSGGKKFIGHVGLIEEVPDDFDPSEGWHRLTILQCHGPNGFKPGVVRTDGSLWDHHDSVWPKAVHRTVLVRPRER